MSDLISCWTKIDEENAEKWKWFEGPRITSDDLKHGSGRIEKCSAREIFKGSGGGAGDGGAARTEQRPTWRSQTSVKKAPPKIEVMLFGKHKGKPLSVIQDEDPGYFAWAVRDVSGFEARARKAGLLENE